ncbi:class IV lanthionine synthetase LanL [Kribbella ginsengisoli]|uniref:Class III lanthionine synthetase LanKC n=1 Tax=Kribbella ginsengisoli TaxID=363865 RepID=A0ABP6Z8S1_9ACTN
MLDSSPDAGRPVGADSFLLADIAHAALDRAGSQLWTVRSAEAWCYITPAAYAMRPHGWKIHVSATPLSAPLVLARSIAEIVRLNGAFKFATDIRRVIELNRDWYSRGGSGKFITVYPQDDEHFRVLAEALHSATSGLPGPAILSDRPYQPGSIVQYRYGTFKARTVFTEDGVFETMMSRPDGTLVHDERTPWFSPPPWAQAPPGYESVEPDVEQGPILLADRYRVHEAIRHANKGGVYRAADIRDGTEVIIKQARAHVGGTLDGCDVRDRLRREADILDNLKHLEIVPAKLALFEDEGDLMLVQTCVPGVPLNVWSSKNIAAGRASAGDVLAIVRALVSALRLLHDAGYVIRDLKPANLIVTPENKVYIIDVEYIVSRGQIVAPGTGTRGFIAPECIRNAQRTAPISADPGADCFSLGITLFSALTGLAPTPMSGGRGEPGSASERRDVLNDISRVYHGVDVFADMIVGLTEPDPEMRWTLDQADRFLARVSSVDTAGPISSALPNTPDDAFIRPERLDQIVTTAFSNLMRTMTTGSSTLWPMNREPGGERDRCGAWHGAAGVLASLTLAARVGVGGDELRDTVAAASKWIGERAFDVPRFLPGLGFGRSGTAWALFDASAFLGDDELGTTALQLAKRLPTRGPIADVTHGLSGAGLTHIHLWQMTGDTQLLEGACAAAAAVISAARRRGDDWIWPTPSIVNSKLAGNSTYGFAHGIAGVGTFLVSAAQAAGARSESFLEAASGAGDTLLRAATSNDGSIAWPTAIDGDLFRAGGEWCGGRAGIGTFLIRLWDVTQDGRYATAAQECAESVTRNPWSLTAGACCGLAGVGHFLMDMAEFTADQTYMQQANRIAWIIDTTHDLGGEGHLGGRFASDLSYGWGSAGVLGFLLRLRHGGPAMWLPEWPVRRDKQV